MEFGKNHFAQSLDLFGKEGRPVGRWRLEGWVRYPFVGDASIEVAEGDEPIEHASDISDIKNRCKLRRDYDIADVEVGKHEFPGTIETGTDGVGRTTWVYARSRKNLPAGPFEYDVPLIATLKDGTRLSPFPIRIRRADLDAAPTD
ncbi:MAG: hypothetical protein WBC44_11550 [Planctomycetaceae bacterium]